MVSHSYCYWDQYRFLLIGMEHILALLPLLILTKILWGIPSLELLKIVSIFLLTVNTTGNMILLSTRFNFDYIFIVKLLWYSWLVISLCFSQLQIINPFFQIWVIAQPEYHQMLWFGLTLNLCFLILLSSLVSFSFQREVYHKHEHERNL